MPARPVTVTVTGAAGQIGYAALFRIAAGAMLGHDTPDKTLTAKSVPAIIKAYKKAGYTFGIIR